jgi:hypothetical protein
LDSISCLIENPVKVEVISLICGTVLILGVTIPVEFEVSFIPFPVLYEDRGPQSHEYAKETVQLGI